MTDLACCPRDDRELPRDEARRLRAYGLFRALADTTRLELLELIAARPQPICVCDIVSRFELTQPTISHHLKVLREAGLVEATRHGKWSYYEVSDDGLAAARRLIDSVLPEPATAAR